MVLVSGRDIEAIFFLQNAITLCWMIFTLYFIIITFITDSKSNLKKYKQTNDIIHKDKKLYNSNHIRNQCVTKLQ